MAGSDITDELNGENLLSKILIHFRTSFYAPKSSRNKNIDKSFIWASNDNLLDKLIDWNSLFQGMPLDHFHLFHFPYEEKKSERLAFLDETHFRGLQVFYI